MTRLPSAVNAWSRQARPLPAWSRRAPVMWPPSTRVASMPETTLRPGRWSPRRRLRDRRCSAGRLPELGRREGEAAEPVERDLVAAGSDVRERVVPARVDRRPTADGAGGRVEQGDRPALAGHPSRGRRARRGCRTPRARRRPSRCHRRRGPGRWRPRAWRRRRTTHPRGRRSRRTAPARCPPEHRASSRRSRPSRRR